MCDQIGRTLEPCNTMTAEVDQSHLSLLSLEDELTCSICLSPFDSPVTIPCGHNFCQDCLLATWKDSYSCPQCRTVFATKPELKKNTVLSSIVETFNMRSSRSVAGPLVEEESRAEEERVIRCDTCMEAEASQTCLTCMASFCEDHLRPHRENPNYRLHQLSQPVGDLTERICPDHHKLMELFCSQHGHPICSLCLQQVHKGCSFISPEEQRNLKESDFRDKLGLLDVKIEKTETVLFQMNDMQSKLKDAATNRKTALASVYQQMRDTLVQEEREAQHEVDRELEVGQTKLRELLKRFTENAENMRKAREDINNLLSQSQSLDFLQASFDLPRVTKFDPHPPRISLDSAKVMATQAFAAALKEHLTELLKQPVEARLLILKPGECTDEKGAPASETTGSQLKSDQQKTPPSSQSLGCPPVQPFFQPVPVHVPVYSYMGPHGGWNPSQYGQGQSSGPSRGPPFMARQNTNPQTCQGKTKKTLSGKKEEKKPVCKPVLHHPTASSVSSQTIHKKDKKSDATHQSSHKQDKKPSSAPGGTKPSAKGPDFKKKDNPKSHPPSGKSHHPGPKKHK